MRGNFEGDDEMSRNAMGDFKEPAQFLTREQFIHRLLCAGWTREEAESEWSDIDNEPEEDWEGQL